MDLDKDIYYGFVIMLVLILVVYYVGATNVGQTLFTGIVNTVYALTGRSQQGVFQNYPGGGGAAAGTNGTNGG